MYTALYRTHKSVIGGIDKKYWFCQCECGNTAVVINRSLKNGNTKSCGCLKRSGKGSKPRASLSLRDLKKMTRDELLAALEKVKNH